MDRCFVAFKKMGMKWKFLLRFTHLYQVITNETYKVQELKSCLKNIKPGAFTFIIYNDTTDSQVFLSLTHL